MNLKDAEHASVFQSLSDSPVEFDHEDLLVYDIVAVLGHHILVLNNETLESSCQTMWTLFSSTSSSTWNVLFCQKSSLTVLGYFKCALRSQAPIDGQSGTE